MASIADKSKSINRPWYTRALWHMRMIKKNAFYPFIQADMGAEKGEAEAFSSTFLAAGIFNVGNWKLFLFAFAAGLRRREFWDSPTKRSSRATIEIDREKFYFPAHFETSWLCSCVRVGVSMKSFSLSARTQLCYQILKHESFLESELLRRS